MKYVGGKQAPAQKMDPYTGMTPQELQHKIEWSKEFPIYFLHNEVGTTTTTSESLSGFSVQHPNKRACPTTFQTSIQDEEWR